MNICPDCGAVLPEGVTCREYFIEVMGEEYMMMSPRNDYLTAHKLTGVSYMLQHARQHTYKELAFAMSMLEMVFRDHWLPLDAAQALERHFVHRPSEYDETYLRNLPTASALNISNFHDRETESYLQAAYRWGQSVFERVGAEVEFDRL